MSYNSRHLISCTQYF